MSGPEQILANARHQLGLSLRGMATAVEISATRYHQIEAKGETPSLDLARRIIEALDICGPDRKTLCQAWGKEAADQAAAWEQLSFDDPAQAA